MQKASVSDVLRNMSPWTSKESRIWDNRSSPSIWTLDWSPNVSMASSNKIRLGPLPATMKSTVTGRLSGPRKTRPHIRGITSATRSMPGKENIMSGPCVIIMTTSCEKRRSTDIQYRFAFHPNPNDKGVIFLKRHFHSNLQTNRGNKILSDILGLVNISWFDDTSEWLKYT